MDRLSCWFKPHRQNSGFKHSEFHRVEQQEESVQIELSRSDALVSVNEPTVVTAVPVGGGGEDVIRWLTSE